MPWSRLSDRPSARIDLNIAKVWRAFTGGSVIPYLGVAAHQDWIDRHHDLIPGLYRAYKTGRCLGYG